MMKLRNFSEEKLFELLKDACFKESCKLSEKKKAYPDTDDLVKSAERDEIVSLLLEICDREDMSLCIETFALSVSLLDRFLATYKVKSKYLECLAVACLYIACKVKEDDEKISVTSEFIFDCGGKCSIAELLRMELMVLTKFEWNVNDITAVDFLYLFYSIIIKRFNSSKLNMPQSAKSKWRRLNDGGFNFMMTKEPEASYFPPADLDFLHVLEKNLKNCLCAKELTTMYQPRVLAFSLISKYIEKIQKDDSIKELVIETLNQLGLVTKIDAETVNECKEKIAVHLTTLQANETLFERYLDEYNFDMATKVNERHFFTSIPLSTLGSSKLTVIKEEDEEENIQTDSNKPEKMVLCSISNQSFASNIIDDCDSLKKSSNLTYADILNGKHEQQKSKFLKYYVSNEINDYDIENERK